MNELVTLMRDDAVVSSLQIAEHFGKLHKDVLRAIEKAKSTERKNGLSDSPFRKSHYIDESGKKNPMYYLTRDGFSFVVMGFTGKKAAANADSLLCVRSFSPDSMRAIVDADL